MSGIEATSPPEARVFERPVLKAREFRGEGRGRGIGEHFKLLSETGEVSVKGFGLWGYEKCGAL